MLINQQIKGKVIKINLIRNKGSDKNHERRCDYIRSFFDRKYILVDSINIFLSYKRFSIGYTLVGTVYFRGNYHTGVEVYQSGLFVQKKMPCPIVGQSIMFFMFYSSLLSSLSNSEILENTMSYPSLP